MQQKFTEKEKLNFPLYADTEKKAYQAFGVKGRETFVIDKKGTVVKVYGKVASAGAHPEEVLAWIKENLKK